MHMKQKNTMEYITLSNDVKVPTLGIGTYMINPEDAENSVREALKMGYRCVDTANIYGNEKAVGRAIKSSGIDRAEVFVSSKLWVTEYSNEKAIDETLKRLNIEYIDLLYLHQATADFTGAYHRMEKAYREGKIKALGISNFYGNDLKEILAEAEIIPHIAQYERHPYYVGKDVQSVLDEHEIKVMAWYPLGHGNNRLMDEEVFKTLGQK